MKTASVLCVSCVSMEVCPEVTRLQLAEKFLFVKELKVLGEAGEVGRGFLVEKVIIWSG